MRLLLLLISLAFVTLARSDNYEVVEGDTLYSIAQNNQINLIDIYNSNKILGLKPNTIKPGDIIYLPKKFDSSYSKKCYWYSSQYEFSLEKSYMEHLNECINFLSSKIDETIFDDEINDLFWSKFNESEAYTFYAVNMFIKKYHEGMEVLGSESINCPDFEKLGLEEDWSMCTIEQTESEKKLMNILISAAKNGNLHAYYFWDKWDNYFEEKTKKSIIWKLVWDEYDLDYLDSIAEDENKLKEFGETYYTKYDEFCERELYQRELRYELKFAALRSCLSSYGREKNTKFVEFFQNSSKFMSSHKGKFVSYNELTFAVNSAYYLLNANYFHEAFSVLTELKNRICIDCSDSQELIDKFFKYNNENGSILGQGYHDALLTFDLNYTTLEIVLNDLKPDEIKKIRNKSLELNEEYFEKYDLEKNGKNRLEKNQSYAAIYSDYAARLIRWGLCQDADEQQSKAQKIYENFEYSDRYAFNNWDEFHESLGMANCFLSLAKYNPDTINADNTYKKASQYFQIAKNYLQEFENQKFVKNNRNRYINSIDLALLETVDLAVNIKSYSFEQFRLKTKKIDNMLKEAAPENSFGSEDDLDLLHSIYTKLYFYVTEKFKEYDIKLLIDPIDIFNHKTNVFLNNRIINLKVDASTSNLKSLQKELETTAKKIDEIKSNSYKEESYKKLINLYQRNADIVTEILNTNKNIENIVVSKLPNISEIQQKLKPKDHAVFIVDGEIKQNGTAILISKESVTNYQIEANIKIKKLIESVKSSLNPDRDYDFESAKMLYDIFFRPIENKISKDSTIYLFGNSLNGINPWILVRNYNDSKNISEYERTISAEWLIQKFNVVKNFQIPSQYENIEKYNKKFLGYGNSTTYSQLGLPNLNEVDNEIRELAVISNGNIDDILLNRDATKSNLLMKLEDSYERVVISTHAVESYWKGLTSEPALVFNNADDDFFLTPSEIINLNLKTDMVILSSCSSSISGFDNLYKSFLFAGAKSVIYTNWELESKYASEFTTSFLKELWFSPDRKHEALRKTSVNFIKNYEKKEYAHPAFWGNFSIAYQNL